jgi:cytochrome c-type biogenesis protein CcmF
MIWCSQIGFILLLLAMCLCASIMVQALLCRHQLILCSHYVLKSIRAACGLVLLSYVCLTLCFLANAFNVSYVLQHSSILLPWYYKFCAVWGGHEGSILLWITILSMWTLLLTFQTQHRLDDEFALRIWIVLAVILLGLISFIVLTSNPFALQFSELSSKGRDLNPLLQDPGFLLHPPMLYLGYVGYAIPFAFAMAALWLGRIDSTAFALLKPWAMLSWCCLTLGITLGSWWAYRELGWGGFWFWDPVENASLMPWIVGTGLLHAVIVSEKQQTFLAWTILLAITAFALSLIGTFLVRSGVLTSVHAFAVDPKRGLYILLFLMLMMVWAFVMYVSRAHHLLTHKRLHWLSRESSILMNNILLFVMMLVVLLGTLYPLMVDGLGLGKISVGAPYFNQTLFPILLIFLCLMGLGIQLKWVKQDTQHLLKRFIVQFAIAFGFAFSLLYLFYNVQCFVLMTLTLSFWVIVSVVYSLLQRYKQWGKLPRTAAYWAMFFAHIGFAFSIIGIIIVSYYDIERDVHMKPGEIISLQDYQIQFHQEVTMKGPNYHGSQIQFSIQKGPYHSIVLPEKRIYDIGQMVMTDADIDYNLWRDIYVALGSPIGETDWSVRLYYKPMIRWIWLGGILMTLGGGLAFLHYIRAYFRKKS